MTKFRQKFQNVKKQNFELQFEDGPPNQIMLVLSVGNFIILLALIIGFSKMGGKIEELSKLVQNKLGIHFLLFFRE